MDATLSPHSARRRRQWAVRPWTLVVLLLLVVGTLIQACSDNNGTTGPTLSCNEMPVKSGNIRTLSACTSGTPGTPAPTTGFANTSADILIRVQANPASTEPGRRVGIVVIVTNGAAGASGGSGQPLPGLRVQVNTSTNAGTAFGQVDAPTGITDSNGIYTTTMLVRCSDAGLTERKVSVAEGTAATTITVDAFVNGASSAAGGTSATVTVTGQSSNPPCTAPTTTTTS